MFLKIFSDKEDVARNFDVKLEELEHVGVLLASYDYENYSGDAFVLYRDTRDGQLYEVHGSHCSCYGLEGQWEPEVCDLKSLRHRVYEGNLGVDNWSGNNFAEELKQVLEGLSE